MKPFFIPLSSHLKSSFLILRWKYEQIQLAYQHSWKKGELAAYKDKEGCRHHAKIFYLLILLNHHKNHTHNLVNVILQKIGEALESQVICPSFQ